MRHAKSDYPEGVADHDRPLAKRGVREAGLAGDWLRSNVEPIDAVLCSSAVRTRQTLVRTGISAPVTHLEQLYGATPATMIGEISAVGDHVTSLCAKLAGNAHDWFTTEFAHQLDQAAGAADGTPDLAGAVAWRAWKEVAGRALVEFRLAVNRGWLA